MRKSYEKRKQTKDREVSHGNCCRCRLTTRLYVKRLCRRRFVKIVTIITTEGKKKIDSGIHQTILYRIRYNMIPMILDSIIKVSYLFVCSKIFLDCLTRRTGTFLQFQNAFDDDVESSHDCCCCCCC